MEVVVNDFKFDWLEYAVVAAMLLLCTLIGVYYAFFNKQKTFKDYMLGGRSMGVFPVTMSLVSSFTSGLTIMGIPTEIYLYGTQYMAVNFSIVIFTYIIAKLYVPVYFKLQIESVFEYLELRFNKHVKILGIFLCALLMVLYVPVSMYAPALTFSQVTGLPVLTIAVIISLICIFYTSVGGLKAVMWTDVLQNAFSIFAITLVVLVGCSNLGGLQEVLRINEEGGRLEMFNMNTDPFQRHTFWTVTIGLSFMCLNMAVMPSAVQKYVSVSTLRESQLVVYWSSVGFFLAYNLIGAMGLVLYARYHKCDPVAAGVIKNHSNLLPLYVMEIGKDFPGLAGLFMAGLASATLSSIAGWLNAVGGILYKGIKDVYFPHVNHSEATQSRLTKLVVLSSGLICVSLVLVVDKLGTLLQLVNTILGVITGATLSLYSLGIFFPRVNAKGAVAGCLASLFMTSWIAAHAQYYISVGKLRFPAKTTSIEYCPLTTFDNLNSSSALLHHYSGLGSPTIADDSVGRIYQLSYNYFVVVGTFFGIFVGVLISLLSDPPNLSGLSPDLFSPYVHRYLPEKMREAYKSAPGPQYFLAECVDPIYNDPVELQPLNS